MEPEEKSQAGTNLAIVVLVLVIVVVGVKLLMSGAPAGAPGTEVIPADGVETLLDSEVYPIIEYKGVQVFVDKMDVKPYNRFYTKFNKNQFRYFERKLDDDTH